MYWEASAEKIHLRMVAVDHSHGVSFSFLCTLSQMDHVLMELKKDNIMEETLEADLPLRHGVETGLLSSQLCGLEQRSS